MVASQTYCYHGVMARGVDTDQRRTALAHAVWAVIARDGAGAVTVRRVAAEAGVSVGRVQHYFPHKDELLRHACQAMVDQAAESFAERSADRDSRTVLRELVVQPIPSTRGARVGISVWQAFLAWSLQDEAIAALIRTELDGTRALIADLLRAVSATRADGAAGGFDADVTASALLALGHGLAQQVMAGSMTYPDAVRAADDALAWIGVSARG